MLLKSMSKAQEYGLININQMKNLLKQNDGYEEIKRIGSDDITDKKNGAKNSDREK